MKNFILTSLKNFRKYYRRKLLWTFCRKFLKMCGKIFGNIWNYFTNISKKFGDFFLGCGTRGNAKKYWKFLEHFKENFLGKFKKYLVCVAEKILENEYILEEV